MKFASLTSVLIAIAAAPALAADDMSLERMATCQDSWLDWQKNNPAQLKLFGQHFGSVLIQKGDDQFLVPKARISIAGFPVTQVFPNSVGMGVGFSVSLDAKFDDARHALEKVLGKPFVKCEVGDGMRTCGRQIADKRTLTIMASDDAKSSATLAGCYYFYEK